MSYKTGFFERQCVTPIALTAWRAPHSFERVSNAICNGRMPSLELRQKFSGLEACQLLSLGKWAAGRANQNVT